MLSKTVKERQGINRSARRVRMAWEAKVQREVARVLQKQQMERRAQMSAIHIEDVVARERVVTQQHEKLIVYKKLYERLIKMTRQEFAEYMKTRHLQEI